MNRFILVILFLKERIFYYVNDCTNIKIFFSDGHGIKNIEINKLMVPT